MSSCVVVSSSTAAPVTKGVSSLSRPRSLWIHVVVMLVAVVSPVTTIKAGAHVAHCAYISAPGVEVGVAVDAV